MLALYLRTDRIRITTIQQDIKMILLISVVVYFVDVYLTDSDNSPDICNW